MDMRRSIETAPDDFRRPGGQRSMLVQTRSGRVLRAKRTDFNNSGWLEVDTNREVWPVFWLEGSLSD